MPRLRSLEKMKQRLIELIIERTFRFTETPSFKLASGTMSNYYFNCKPTTLNSEGMYLVGNLMYALVKSRKSWKARAVGGLTLGADPVSNAIAYAAYMKDDPFESFVVRKEPKKHGTALQLEGYVKEGDTVVIVDDVVTTGASTIKVIEVAESQGVKILAVILLLDRQEQNGMENIQQRGYPASSILELKDFL